MSVNVPAGQRRVWATRQARRLMIAERRLAKPMRAEINATAELIARGSGVDLDNIVGQHAAQVGALLRKHYSAVMPDFGDRVIADLAEAKFFEPPPGYVAGLQAWIDQHATAALTAVAGQTRKLASAALQEAAGLGLGYRETAKLIMDKTGGAVAGNRAMTIAWTETHSAAVAATQIAAETSLAGLPNLTLTREWVSTSDARTRPNHTAADGQRVSMTDPFKVGGALLQHPGDPLGPAAEVINCRCVMLFHTETRR